MSEQLLFYGDIKGTKDALSTLAEGGIQTLQRRIQNLHDSFGEAFFKVRDRSRSLTALTFSDSVIAYWTDVNEGRRFAIDFMLHLWSRLDRSLLQFRGFLDVGEVVPETSAITHALALRHGRFMKAIPVSVAAWSVAMAEASHFPDGLFVSVRLTQGLPDVQFTSEVYSAGRFEYRQMCVPVDV